MSEASQQPVAGEERAQILDVLRGFALLGILLSHVPTFSGYEFLEPAQQAPLDVWKTDGIVRDLTSFFVRGKFYSLFSLLFGIGFSMSVVSYAAMCLACVLGATIFYRLFERPFLHRGRSLKPPPASLPMWKPELERKAA